MIPRPPISTLTDTLGPYTPLFRSKRGILVRPGHGKILNLAVMTSINPVERVCEHSDHKGSCTSTRKHGALDDRLSKTITAWPWSQMVANLCVVSRCSLTDWRLAKGSGGDQPVANPGQDRTSVV